MYVHTLYLATGGSEVGQGRAVMGSERRASTGSWAMAEEKYWEVLVELEEEQERYWNRTESASAV